MRTPVSMYLFSLVNTVAEMETGRVEYHQLPVGSGRVEISRPAGQTGNKRSKFSFCDLFLFKNSHF